MNELMSKTSLRALGEFAAVASVVLSLVFVGLQFRQSAIASRAAAYQELGIAKSNIWFMTANNRELSDLMGRAELATQGEFSEFSDSDRMLVLRYIVGVLRLYETVYLQVEQGLLEADALSSLGWEGFGRTSLLKMNWPDAKRLVDPSFADYLENSATLSD